MLHAPSPLPAAYLVRCRIRAEPDIAVNAKDLSDINPLGSKVARAQGWINLSRLTTSLTGSSGTVSSISISLSVTLSTKACQSFSDCRKSASFTVDIR